MPTLPNIKINSPRTNSVVKVTTDRALELTFTSDQPELEYDLWTNWGSGEFHSESVLVEDDGNFRAVLPADVTGFFTVSIRYKPPKEKTFVSTQVEFEVQYLPARL
jgi:hypothetical protein